MRTSNKLILWAFVLLLAVIGVKQVWAQDTTTADVGIVVVEEWYFGANKREVLQDRYVIPDVNPLTCVAEAATLQTALRTEELRQAGVHKANSWQVKSAADCHIMQVVVPDSTVVVGALCVVNYETGKTYETMMAEQCPDF
jgi:hypothetical protein